MGMCHLFSKAFTSSQQSRRDGFILFLILIINKFIITERAGSNNHTSSCLSSNTGENNISSPKLQSGGNKVPDGKWYILACGFRKSKGCECARIIFVAFNSPQSETLLSLFFSGCQFIKSTLTSLMFASTQ